MEETTRKPAWVVSVIVLFSVLLPLLLILNSLRLLLTESFIRMEYQTPAFPQDPYGFTLEDRLHWAPIALDYLLNEEGIGFLGELELENGVPAFNERELSHLVDVKGLVQPMLQLWAVGWIVVGIGVAALVMTKQMDAVREAFHRAAKVTGYTMLGLALALAAGFSFVFVGFHRIFFEGDTWLFPYSDTSIRLFPERFWRDTFIFIVAFTLVQAGIMYMASRRRSASKD